MPSPMSHPDHVGCPETGLSKALEALVPLFLLTLILVIYWQVTAHGFINYRDGSTVVDNPYVRRGLTAKGVAASFKAFLDGSWGPLAWFSHMLDWELYGPYPGWHHLTSVFFHSINTLLLFVVLKNMTGTVWPSAFVAAVFAVHPVNVETVAWVAERKGVLSAFFWLLTLWSYVRYTEKPGFRRYAPCLVFYGLGLMTGPLVLALPIVLLLMDCWPLARFTSRTENRAALPWNSKNSPADLVWEKLPFAALAGAYAGMLFLAHHQSPGGPSASLAPGGFPLGGVPPGYVAGLGKILWSKSLAPGYPSLYAFPLGTAAGAAAFSGALSLASLWLLRTAPYLAAGWFWYIAALTPALLFPEADAMPAVADRFAYVPAIGISIGIAWGTVRLFQRMKHGRIVLWLGAGVALSGLMALAWTQAGLWRNSATLFTHAARLNPADPIARNKLGVALSRQGNQTEALRELTEAIRLKPDYAEAHANLGLALHEQARFQEAIAHFSQALMIDPQNADAHAYWALALTRSGLLQEAKKHYMEALQIDPDHAEAHNNLGVVLYGEGRFDDAVHHYSEALRLRPDYGDAQKNLNNLLRLTGAPPDARDSE